VEKALRVAAMQDREQMRSGVRCWRQRQRRDGGWDVGEEDAERRTKPKNRQVAKRRKEKEKRCLAGGRKGWEEAEPGRGGENGKMGGESVKLARGLGHL
jgi:hypothetical protein